MKRRITCLVLTAVMLLSTISVAFAEEKFPPAVITVDNTDQYTISEEEAIQYSRYFLCLPEGVRGDVSSRSITAADITELCREISAEMYGGVRCATFMPEIPPEMLPNNSELTSVSSVADIIYVQYTSSNGADVTASYDLEGFHDLFVYYPDDDRGVYISHDTRTEYAGFRFGNYETICEENVNQQNEENQAPPLRSGTKYNFASSAEMLQDLKSHFPVTTTAENFAIMCPALGAYRAVKVTGARYNYQLITANFRLFAVSTAITVIAAYLGQPAPVVVNILTAIGAAISSYSYILDEVRLYGAGNFSYMGTKTGYVYDTTVYNEYVYVKNFASSGSFAGGYDAQGVFHWVENNPSSAWHMSNSSVANAAMNDYNWDVSLNGRCMSYSPSGFW